MAIISVVDRKMGYDDIAFGIGSYTYTDVNGVTHTIPEVSARNLPLDNLAKVSDAIGWHPVVTSLESCVASLGSTSETLYFPAGTYAITNDLTIPLNVAVRFEEGGIISIPNGKTLTILGPLAAGQYQIFSCTGTGKVAGLKRVCPQWFGAKGDNSTDDTAALVSSSDACTEGGVICFWPGTYKTTGWLVTKTLSLVAESPMSFGTVAGVKLKAIGAQDYVLKLSGTFAADASTFLQPYLININIDGDNKVISDAALVMEYCNFSLWNRVGVQNVEGHGVRLRTCWETRILYPWINNCGVLDTGAAFYVDAPAPLDYTRGTNNLMIFGGTWASNRGRWIQVSSLANLDACWIENNKFELDNLAIMNTVDTNVIHIGAMTRTSISNNTFATFGASYGKYANLIWIGGVNDDGDNGSPGGMGNIIKDNRYIGLLASGAINGLSLAANAPPVIEDNNQAWTVDPTVLSVPNVNVSIYRQFIKRSFKSFGSVFYTQIETPSIEHPGFISIHKIPAANVNIPTFVASTTCVNDSKTVAQFATAGATSFIALRFDLSRFIGSTDKNLVMRIRMRLDAAGSVTVKANPNAPGVFNDVDNIVTSTDWAWYTYAFPIANLTTANHLLDVWMWTINVGAPKLLVDGMEFFTSNGYSAVTTPAVPATTVNALNSTAFPVRVTVTGGTVTVIAIGPAGSTSATGAIAGSFILQPGWAIAITYTVAPTWVWVGE